MGGVFVFFSADTAVDPPGTGSFGRVMLAVHKSTGKRIAIKILKKEKVVRVTASLCSHPSYLNAISIQMKQVDHTKYEKQILDQIRCPFIVNLVGFFQDKRNLYLVMEYVPGGEMFYHLRRAGRYQRRRSIVQGS